MKNFLKHIFIASLMFFVFLGTVKADQLIVGVDANFRPFEFKNSEGVFTGFDVELWDAVAKDLGLDYKWQTMDFNGIIPALQSKSIDAAIAAITIKSQREKVVDFSYPYYDAGLSILVREDNNNIKTIEDLNGKVIATKLATTSADFLKKNVKAKDIKLLPSTDNLIMELITGGVDAVFFDSPPLMYYANNQGKGKVKIAGPIYEGQSYGIAFPQGSDLREKVSITILKFKEDGTYDKLYEKWFGQAPM